jgi:uncharacterized protein (TIGR03118 family)
MKALRGRRGRRWAARALGVAGAAAALGAGLGPPTAGAADNTRYGQTNLVSDQAGMARLTDPNLVNAWGLAAAPGGPIWTANNGTNTSTLYAGANGLLPPFKVPLTVSIPGGAPTGIVFGGAGGFQLPSHAPALFIYDSEGGEITAWSPLAFPFTSAHVVHTTPGAIYKGLAVAGQRLYAANFGAGTIDVFDQHFAPVDLGDDAFVDEHLPSDYSPFNVQELNGEIYVSYAVHQPGSVDETAGPGLGAVDVYSTDGQLLRRLIEPGGDLNAPWGLAIAPDRFGAFSGDLLVGNFGDGGIHAYDPMSGDLQGTLNDRAGRPLTIDGLWALTPGNGLIGPKRSVLFSAGPDDESHGLFGKLQALTP